MINLYITTNGWLKITGRIDSMTSFEFQKKVDDMILGGARVIVMDLEDVNYMSSAGLRVFIASQQKLKKAGGEIILFGVAGNVDAIFKMGGCDTLFRIVASRKEVELILNVRSQSNKVLTKEISGIRFKYIEKDGIVGDIKIIGSQNKFLSSSYQEKDVTTVKSDDLQFGTGLAALGDHYEEYKNLFGESILINRSLFFFPGIQRPTVDFMLCRDATSNLHYRFLHGFGFNGLYKYLISFEPIDGFLRFSSLIDSFFSVSQANLIGVVILFESKGFFGMNLKKAPILENSPLNGKDILSPENFAQWTNFPIEPSEFNCVIAAVGIAARKEYNIPPSVSQIFSKSNLFHFHGGVFSKEPISTNCILFENELKRVLSDLPVNKIQHILGQTVLNTGLAGIIELEGNKSA